MRFMFWFIGIIIIAGVLAGTARTGEEEIDKPLHMLMDIAGANIVEGELSYWGVLDRPLENIDELGRHAREVADLIGIEEKREWELTEEPGYLMALLEGILPAGVEGRVIVQTLNIGEKRSQDPPSTYVMISLVQQGAGRVLDDYASRLAAFLSGRGRGEISFTLMGEIDGALNPGQEMKLATSLVKQMKGEIVEKIEEDNFVSVIAYVPGIASKIEINGQPANLNIALRYDNYCKKTVIWAGIPVIQDSY